MRLPVIRSASEFIDQDPHRGREKVQGAVDVLEHLSQARGLKDPELEVVGELISNLLGSLEVQSLKEEGKSQSDAMNTFMRRVLGSVDPQQPSTG